VTAPEHNERAVAEAASGEAEPDEKAKILVVDDLLNNRVAMRELLRPLDVQILEAETGLAALQMLLRHELALILMDVQMPNMDGLEATSLIRQNPATRGVPIILVTAHGRDQELEDRGYDLGAVDYLYKPIVSHVLLAKVRVFLDLHRSRRIVGLGRELEASRREVERSRDEIEQFAYVASHDLREPVRMVASFAQLLAKEYAAVLDDRGREWLGYVTDGATRMQQMMDDLLRFSRAGRHAGPAQTVDTSEVLMEVLSILRLRIDEEGAQVSVGELPPVRGERTGIVQVFQNLIENALRYRSERPPEIHVQAHAEGDMVRLSVRDNGVGIAAEHQGRIFQIFARLHRDRHGGLGVGLSLARRIVESSGGRLWVESVPGAGSTFSFTLPMAEGPKEPA